MHIWKLREYLRGSAIMHGSRTHQSVRNVKSTRGYVRADVIKGQRGMMGIERFFFSYVTNVSWILYAHPEALQIFMRTCKYYWRYSSHLARFHLCWKQKNSHLGKSTERIILQSTQMFLNVPECSLEKPMSFVSSDVIRRHPRGPNIGPRRRFCPCPLKPKPSKCPRIQTSRGCL